GLPGMITPGNMSMGLLASFLEAWAGPATLRRLGTTFRGLVLPDRTIRLCAAVTQKESASRSIELDVWVEGDEGERGVLGTALLLANHPGAIPFDGAMIGTAVELRRARTLRFLYDRFVENMGAVATFYRKVGGAVATRENALALLQAGELVLLFPEGVPGVAKTFAERYRLRQFSSGFVRLATALDVPVVPVAVVGAE